MTSKTNSMTGEIARTWNETIGWIADHTTQIGIATLIGAIIIALLYGVKLFGQWLSRERPGGTHWYGIVGKTLRRTKFWFMFAVAAQIVSRLGSAPDDVAQFVRAIFLVAMALQVAIWTRALILGIIEHRAGEADPSGSLGSAVGLIRLLVTTVLFILATVVILANLGVDVTGLVAGLGIGGIAIGLAAQGIFSDLFAALSILFDKPFRRGDTIRWDTTTGTVEAIGLKSSRVRALSGEEIIISNANLLGKELRNFARIERRRVTQLISLVYNTPLETSSGLGALLEPEINACEGCIFVRCGLETFAPSSLDFTLIYDIDAEDPAEVLKRKNTVNIAILKLFDAQGIAFAYPTQTTYTAAPDGTLVMPYAPPTSGKVVHRK